MAGYIFNLSSIDSLKIYIENGIYSTIISEPNNRWLKHHEATFGDYATMEPGDNIYFFINRKIYGIGELVELNGNCKYLNFPGANRPIGYTYESMREFLLWDEGDISPRQRWICLFKPSPYFFEEGLDMDDVLASNPSKFRMLRAFWKVSFIKVDDDENQALKDFILRNNIDKLSSTEPNGIFESNYDKYHSKLSDMIDERYHFNCEEILSNCANEDYLTHEMAIEAGILYQLSKKDELTINVFGEWDYLSHQVIASPFKPIDYMDKMDIFGYKYITSLTKSNTKYRFLVLEIKKDTATETDITQLMKYVDWVKDEYAFGDFSMIKAFLVAYDYDNRAKDNLEEIAKRQYIVGRRPVKSAIWQDLWLVNYKFCRDVCALRFEFV